MAIPLNRLDNIRTRFVADDPSPGPHLPPPSAVLGAVVRGLLVGIGLAAVLVGRGTSIVGIVVVGLLALGVSLVAWDE